DGVGAQHEFQPRRGDGFLDHRIVQRDSLLHVGETFFGVVADPEEPRFVAQIVLEHDADVGIEVYAALRHQLKGFIVPENAVFDLSATGADGRFDRFSGVSVNHGPYPLRLRFAAHRRELFVGHRLTAAVADALRSEDLHDIRALRLQLTDDFAKLLRRAAVLIHLTDRGQDARARQTAARDRLT